MKVHEKRTQLRVDHQVEFHIDLGAEQISAVSRNLSLGGTFLKTPTPLKEGARIRLRFSLPTQPDPIVTDAQVRWTEADGAGICFGGLRAREMYALTKFLGADI